MDAVPSTQAVLDIRGVSKSFPGVRALSNVDFECRAGEVHALVGENGSGKSTLIKAASGVLQADEGAISIGGELLGEGGGVPRARRLGLITAYQDTSLVEDLTVSENISLSFNAIGQPVPSDLAAILDRFSLPFKPTDVVASLGPGARQILEVARAMAHRPRVLMLDEPTAALDMRLAAQLEVIIKQARDEGTAIVYVSHRLEEIRRLADRLTVIRDGEIQGSFVSDGWDVHEIVELMVGAPTELEYPDRRGTIRDEKLLEVQELTGLNFGPVSLEVRAGEIVGVAGAEGNGQRALLRGIIGIDRTGGATTVAGKTSTRMSPASALADGISFQSGDRAAESTFAPLSVMANATIQLDRGAGPAGLALSRRLLPAFNRAKSQLGIVSASPHQPISGLSGGNQQKIVLARPALKAPKVLVVDEPTQGVDAKARLDIYKVLADAADDGLAVLINSSDSAELAGLCDRVYVMSRGTVINEMASPTTEREIVHSFVSATDVDRVEDLPVIGKSSWAARLLRHSAGLLPIAVLLVLIGAVGGYTASQTPVFWTSFNLANLLILTLPLAFVALGQQFAMIGGLIDISVGSTMSLAVVLVSVTLPDMTSRSVLTTVLVLAAAAIGVGVLNTVLIEVLQINAIVATIASLGIIQGISILIRPQIEGVIAFDLVTMVGQGIGYVPYAFIALVVLAVGLEFWLYRRPRGLALRALGFNMESSSRLGERVRRTRALCLMAAALGAVVGGVFLASQTGMGSNSAGSAYTLPCFAAVFLGGAVMTGGRGSFIGAMLGALFLALVNNVTPLLGIAAAWQQVIYGSILIMAISVYATMNRLRNRGLN